MPSTPPPSRRSVLLSSAAAGLSLAARPVLAAQTGGEADMASRRKINLAGRQRMLSQRMSRAVLFAALDVDTKTHLKMLAHAHTTFDHTQAGLRAGDASLGLQAEAGAAVLARLDEVDSIWEVFGAALANLIDTGTVTEADIRHVERYDMALLTVSSAVVKALVAEYGDKSTDIGLAIAIDIAGRQRMLSQKMAKEAAMIALGVAPAEMQAALGKSVQLFDSSLTALTDGLPTVTLPVPPEHIRAKLLEGRRIWKDYHRVIGFIADTGIASNIELGAIAAQADPLLAAMNEVVTLYEQL